MIDIFAATFSAISTTIPFPNIDPVIISFGEVPLVGELAIRWYSLSYLAGLLFAGWYMGRIVKKPGAPMSKDHLDDMIFWATIGIIAGGRLGYVLFYGEGKFFNDPLLVFRFADGGMSFHGGLIGVVLAVIFIARKNKLNLMRVADLVAIVSPIGLLCGRIANFINGELWGRATDVPWAMVFPDDPSQLARHPSQLYEAFGEGLLLFIILQILYHRTNLPKKSPGVIAGLFFIGYGLARITVEFFREPDSHIGLIAGISRGQMLSVPMFLLAAWLIHKGMNHSKTRTKP
ncbi:prolipoprotein diacylglyceryl transferase [Kordiimonas sp. SCSIO 12610]|uniref:prolipoprotein diacylglyceryl transferase n=1 Tax=Kordiimonas sp. SCSIO 12610 TaxID=2829597 RepID=UPI00210A14F8|nr:prolipoprotein diacylglyceryl transferase [Kordiimonas sp. SCSIO 12610]UTW54971.1 prolipoprotein diacylglyceryl transferase [Kordiimonas sp. SCSIO 12610]